MKYAQFNGTTGYITVASDAALNFGTGDYSICFWGKDIFSANGIVAFKDDGTAGYVAKYELIGRKMYLLTAAGGVPASAYFIVPAVTDWSHVVLIRHGTIVTAYFNGASIAVTGTSTAGNCDSTAVLEIGRQSPTYLSGSLDDVRFFNKALSAGEITKIYNAGRGSNIDIAASGFSWGMDFDTVSGSTVVGIKSDGVQLNGAISGGVTLVTGGVPFTPNYIEEAIYSLLTSNAGVSALVSTRVYPNMIPQGKTLPAIVYQQISGQQVHDCDGPDSLTYPRFQITCIDDDYAGVVALSRAVKSCMGGYTGTQAGVYIQNIIKLDEGDIPSIDPESEQLHRFGKRLDFEIWFNEI